MKQLKVLTLVGGISKNSINKELYNAIKGVTPQNLELSTFDISELPFFSQDIENDPPGKVKDLKNLIQSSDAILFITPEYNRSIPGVLKNAIDWASRPYGTSAWKGKKAAVLGMSPGKTGTMSAQQHLRLILNSLNITVLPQPEIYLTHSETLNEAGEFASDRTKEFIKKFLGTFSDFIS